jgi:hypothetical protein
MPQLPDDFADLLIELVEDREHLLANKRSSGRPQDLVDADALESID